MAKKWVCGDEFFEREMKMEMGWRVEQWIGRGSQQLPRGFFQRREERVGEKLWKWERGKKERIKNRDEEIQ